MNLTLQEVDHLLLALRTMSSYNTARSEQLQNPGVTNIHLQQKLEDYRLRLSQ
jgi:hypothetical protein